MPDTVAGRHRRPQADGRPATTTWSSTTTPAATPSGSTASTPAAATGPRTCRRSSRTTPAPPSIRMQQETRPGGAIDGAEQRAGSSPPGTSSPSTGHFDANGEYVLTRVEHDGHLGGAYTTRRTAAIGATTNRFACIPLALPFRPPPATAPARRSTGPQTAVVVGPSGRGDLHRQVRPGEGAVPLGPRGQERRRTARAGSASASQLGRASSGA